jgi:transcription-repair coupling factor (superfamily II helicase)
VFFVHNRIETIVAVADHLKRLAPRARVDVGHGQMPERALEDVMRRFVIGEVDVLVSTMIVESGLDVQAKAPARGGL